MLILRDISIKVIFCHLWTVMTHVIDCPRAEKKHLSVAATIPSQRQEHPQIPHGQIGNGGGIAMARRRRRVDNHVHCMYAKKASYRLLVKQIEFFPGGGKDFMAQLQLFHEVPAYEPRSSSNQNHQLFPQARALTVIQGNAVYWITLRTPFLQNSVTQPTT